MATNPAIPTTIPTTKTAAQALLDKLYAANPITLGDSEAVSDAIVEVNAILTQLNQEDIASRTGAMQAVAADLKDPVKKLGELKDQLAQVASRVKTLGDIAKDIDSVIGGCKSVFGI
jgi:ABC-type transporter Mla subunit MlaD